MPPGWFNKKKDEAGSAHPSWLDEDEPAGGREAQDDMAVGGDETSPLVADNDDDGSGYGGTFDAQPGGDDDDDALPGMRSRDEESNVSSWHEEGGVSPTSTSPSSPEASGSGRSSSSRPASLSKQTSTRTRMNEYKAKVEDRRRKMLSGLPRRNCCHALFIFLNMVAVAACLCMILSEVIPLFFVEQTLLQITLRSYITFFCLIFIVAELELPLPFVGSSQSLHNFLSKGFNYTFVAIVGLEQAQADLVEETVKHRSADPMGIEWGWFHALFVEVPAYIMFGTGVIYMIMGLLCMRRVRDRCREDYAQRMEEYFEARESEKKSLLVK